MLVLSRKIDEKIIIDEKITISVIGINGGRVRIGIEAPKDVKVRRQELLELYDSSNEPEPIKNS